MLLVLTTKPLFWWTGQSPHALKQSRKIPRHNERSEVIPIECSKAIGEPPATGRQRLTTDPSILERIPPTMYRASAAQDTHIRHGISFDRRFMDLTTLNFRLKPGRNQSQPEPILTPIPRPHSVYVDCSRIYVPPRAKPTQYSCDRSRFQVETPSSRR